MIYSYTSIAQVIHKMTATVKKVNWPAVKTWTKLTNGNKQWLILRKQGAACCRHVSRCSQRVDTRVTSFYASNQCLPPRGKCRRAGVEFVSASLRVTSTDQMACQLQRRTSVTDLRGNAHSQWCLRSRQWSHRSRIWSTSLQTLPQLLHKTRRAGINKIEHSTQTLPQLLHKTRRAGINKIEHSTQTLSWNQKWLLTTIIQLPFSRTNIDIVCVVYNL